MAKKTRQITKSKTKKHPVAAATRTKKGAPKKGLIHHTKRLYHVTPKFVHGMVVGAFVGILVLVPLGSAQNADALSIKTTKDCDAWSIVNCGVTSTANLKNAYDQSSYVKHVYSYFTISATDMSTIGKKAVKGTVYNDGRVTVDGKVVATKAKTAARLRVTNKDQRVTKSGSVFYTRPIALSWSHTSGPAYVVMKSGKFDFAILASCGNPITATPKKTLQAEPVPTPHTPNPTPTPPQTDTDVTPPSTTPVKTASITTLPKTGIGAVGFVFLMAVIGGFVFHKTHHHVKKRRSAKKHSATTHHRKASHVSR
ncbi:hypothetical protein KDA23_05915 [Candidatus Saccharibacteria bacterium]|nr:hypothetical protein [Candidatus Saccharibacteria bacterium]